MAAPTLRSPGPGYRPLQLSDGSSIWMPPEATVDNWRTATQQGETALNQKYMAQAAQQNAPVTTKSKVYSATAVRPNDLYGHLMGWIDHNLGGNALNANPTAQAAVNSYTPLLVVQSGARIATGAVDANPITSVGRISGSPGVGNIAKHVAAKVVPASSTTCLTPRPLPACYATPSAFRRCRPTRPSFRRLSKALPRR